MMIIIIIVMIIVILIIKNELITALNTTTTMGIYWASIVQFPMWFSNVVCSWLKASYSVDHSLEVIARNPTETQTHHSCMLPVEPEGIGWALGIITITCWEGALVALVSDKHIPRVNFTWSQINVLSQNQSVWDCECKSLLHTIFERTIILCGVWNQQDSDKSYSLDTRRMLFSAD